jgi:hypothetical protein
MNILGFFYSAGFEITAEHVAINDRQEIAYAAEKQCFQPEKAGKVMTADREFWERYFKPCSEIENADNS